jgi:hypothetical protein
MLHPITPPSHHWTASCFFLHSDAAFESKWQPLVESPRRRSQVSRRFLADWSSIIPFHQQRASEHILLSILPVSSLVTRLLCAVNRARRHGIASQRPASVANQPDNQHDSTNPTPANDRRHDGWLRPASNALPSRFDTLQRKWHPKLRLHGWLSRL